MNRLFLLYGILGGVISLALAKEIRGIPNYFPSAFLRVGHTEKFVAFSAGLTQNLNFSSAVNITYDRVFLNLGNGYDQSTGIFTCPHAGTYAFLIHGLSQSISQLNLDVFRNNDYIVSAYAHVRNDYASAHQSVVLQLDEDDTVHIQGRGLNYMFGQPREIYATFSGFVVVPNIGRHVTKTTPGTAMWHLEDDTVHVQGRGVNYMYGQSKEVYSTFSGFMVVPNNPGQSGGPIHGIAIG